MFPENSESTLGFSDASDSTTSGPASSGKRKGEIRKRDLTIPGTATEGWLRALGAFALAMLLVAVVQRTRAARHRSASGMSLTT